MTVVTQSLSSCKNNSKNDEEKVSTKYRENVLKSKSYLPIILTFIIFQALETNSQPMHDTKRIFLKMALKQTFCGVVFALIVMNVIYFLPFSNCTNLAENISSHCDDDLPRNQFQLGFWGFWLFIFWSLFIYHILLIYLLLRSIEEPYSPIPKLTPKDLRGFCMFKIGLFCGVFLFLTVKCIPFQNEIINAIANWAPMVILLICLVVYIFLINYCKKYAEEWTKICEEWDKVNAEYAKQVKEKHCQDLISQIVHLKKVDPCLEIEKIFTEWDKHYDYDKVMKQFHDLMSQIVQLKIDNPDLEIGKIFIKAKAEFQLRKKSN